MTELEIIQTVIRTLNSISVSGAENMKKLLGCIEALQQIEAVEESRPDERGDLTDGGPGD